MAIDYKVEWEKLRKSSGWCTMIKNGATSLECVMDEQIRTTVHNREKKMERYIKGRMITNIDGGTKCAHNVDIIVNNFRIGHVPINKKLFEEWCNKEKGGK